MKVGHMQKISSANGNSHTIKHAGCSFKKATRSGKAPLWLCRPSKAGRGHIHRVTAKEWGDGVDLGY